MANGGNPPMRHFTLSRQEKDWLREATENCTWQFYPPLGEPYVLGLPKLEARADHDRWLVTRFINELEFDNCQCGRNRCRQKHSLHSAPPPTDLAGRKEFLREYVQGEMRIGPGNEIQAKSFAEGRYYDVQKMVNELRLVEVAFKECPHPGCRRPQKDGTHLPGMYYFHQQSCTRCGTPWGRSGHRIIGSDRIVLVSLFTDDLFWHCGGCGNYYIQGECRHEPTEPWDKGVTPVGGQWNVAHADPHQACPLSICRTPHPQRFYVLWIRDPMAPSEEDQSGRTPIIQPERRVGPLDTAESVEGMDRLVQTHRAQFEKGFMDGTADLKPPIDALRKAIIDASGWETAAEVAYISLTAPHSLTRVTRNRVERIAKATRDAFGRDPLGGATL